MTTDELDRLLAIIHNRIHGAPSAETEQYMQRILSDYQSGFDPRKPFELYGFVIPSREGRFVKAYPVEATL
jgi:hypothetical protein